MNLDLKKNYEVIEEGTVYSIPFYDLVPEEGLKIFPNVRQNIIFVRGSKNPDDNIEFVKGLLHEELLNVMIHDLKYKNTLVPSRETSIVITKLEEALLWMYKRQIDREERGVQGTYQK